MKRYGRETSKQFSRFINRATTKAGSAPGTLAYIGEEQEGTPQIEVIDYDEDTVTEDVVEHVEDVFPYRDEPSVTWINVDGVHDSEIIKKLGDHFGIHPLVQEDIMNTEQRPKLEEFEDYLFIVFKTITYNEEERIVESEHVSLVLGENFVISFQSHNSDVFDPVRERIRNKHGRIRKNGTDFLVYALLDTVVDNYFLTLELIGEEMEFIETDLLNEADPDLLKRIHSLKQEMLYFRRSIWPLREVINRMERGEKKMITKDTKFYLQDVYDHTIQVMDIIETYRDMLSSMTDLYVSVVGNRMNEIMKVLTVIATIFIPLTFITGVYGMNFEYMPELGVKWAYPAVLAVMGVIGGGMLVYFRRKDWL